MSKHTYSHTVEGKTFTRTTARTYTHLVVARKYNAAFIERQVQGAVKAAQGQWEYFIKCASVNAGDKYPDARYSFDVTQRAHDEAVQALADFSNKGDYVNAKAFAARDRLVTTCNEYGQLGWCGRIDLAEKLANKYRDIYDDIRIEAVAQP